MESMTVKEAELKDLKDIQELNQRLFNNEYENFDKSLDCDWPKNNTRYFKKAIENKDYLALVTFAGKKKVGYLIGCLKETEDFRNIKQIAELQNTFVIEEYRNKGIGTSLYNKFIKWAKKKGMRRIRVTASAGNLRAINFYKKNKFKEYVIILESGIK